MTNTLIFVFGSNLAGRHGKGAAKQAKIEFGAQYGVGVGRTGDAYAIPTKDKTLSVLPLVVIKTFIEEFIDYVVQNPDLEFYITNVGCGLAGYKNEQIAPMFKTLKDNKNCIFSKEWRRIIDN